MRAVDCGSQRFEVDRIRAGYVDRDPSLEGKVRKERVGAVGKR